MRNLYQPPETTKIDKQKTVYTNRNEFQLNKLGSILGVNLFTVAGDQLIT